MCARGYPSHIPQCSRLQQDITVLATHTFSYCQVRPVPLAVQTDAKGATLPTVTAGYAVFLRIDAALEYAATKSGIRTRKLTRE